MYLMRALQEKTYIASENALYVDVYSVLTGSIHVWPDASSMLCGPYEDQTYQIHQCNISQLQYTSRECQLHQVLLRSLRSRIRLMRKLASYVVPFVRSD